MMKPRILDRLLEAGGAQRGYVTAADAKDLDVNPTELRKLAARGRLARVAQGLYRLPTFPRAANDELMEATLWAGRRGVISHDSALRLHDLCDVNPVRIHVTVPSNYRPRKAGGQRYRIWPRDLGPQDLDEVDGIPVVAPARAIADGIDAALESTLVEQAIRTARERRLVTTKEERELRRRLAHRQSATLAGAGVR